MDFRNIPEAQKLELSKLMFEPIASKEGIRDWIRFFLGLEIPTEITDIESTSNPMDAIWQVYNTFRTNSGDVNPGYILLSCREGMKTVSVAILETLLLLHFQLDIAVAAATESQSNVGLQYIDGFIMNIEPLILAAGWQNTTQNKRTIQYKTPEGKKPFIKIIICTSKGMNSIHANAIFLDELDLADPKALKEGKNIVSYSKGIYGVKVYLSTRKYAFGNMAQAIEKADEMRYKILRWNILDVTERCPPERHRPDLQKVDRFVNKSLPLTQISPEEFYSLPDSEKGKWELIQNAHAGCAKCPLLPVCKTKLASKSQNSKSGFYKPISSVLQSFAENDPDTAESQLLCWRPQSAGMVYPRFSIARDSGNVLSIKTAYETFTGNKAPAGLTELTLIQEMQNASISFFAGVDWGYTHDFVITIVAMMPTGEVWLMDTYASPGLEFVDMLNAALSYNEKYGISRWFVDQAAPSNIKSFNKNGLKSPKFTKDVLGGIEAMRSKIHNGVGKRMFRILDTLNNKRAITALSKHRFLTDGQGNVTMTPDDDRGIADICDALRYIGQNLFPVKGPQKPTVTWLDEKGTPIDETTPEGKIKASFAKEEARKASANKNLMKEEINKRLGIGNMTIAGTKKKGGFIFNI